MKKRILEIGNWPPPVCGWSMSLVGLRKELETRGWDCQVMNLNENRKVRSLDYIDVQDAWDYLSKIIRYVSRGYAVHTRVNGEMKKGFLLALSALLLARVWRRPVFLTYAGGHRQSYFPAPIGTFRYLAFWILFRIPQRIYCNSEAVKAVLLTTGIPFEKVESIPHFSAYYVDYKQVPEPPEVKEFFKKHDHVFFSYVCFRKEFSLEFLAEVIRRFSSLHPRIGFLLVGVPDREMDAMREFLRNQNIEAYVCLQPSVPHDVFLTLLSRSLAYIRTPMTDGICSSVLEALKLRIPVLASDNGTRPPGVAVWKDGRLDSLLSLMRQVSSNRAEMIASLPEIELEDNAKKLAESIERVCLNVSGRYYL